jgi:hypothetical protein
MVSLGADNYRVLAQIWDFDTSHTNSTTTLPAWTDGQRASAIPGEAIYGVLFDFSQHSIFTQSISSAVGSLVLVMIIQRFFFRRFALICSSIILAGLFILLGTISLLTAVSSATRGAIGIATMILSYFAFSLGLTLIQEFQGRLLTVFRTDFSAFHGELCAANSDYNESHPLSLSIHHLFLFNGSDMLQSSPQKCFLPVTGQHVLLSYIRRGKLALLSSRAYPLSSTQTASVLASSFCSAWLDAS